MKSKNVSLELIKKFIDFLKKRKNTFLLREGWKRHPFFGCGGKALATKKRYSVQPDLNEEMERERSERVMTE